MDFVWMPKTYMRKILAKFFGIINWQILSVILGAMIIILVGTTIYFAVLSKKLSKSVNQSVPGNTYDDITSPWQPYENAWYRFQLKYPNHWTLWQGNFSGGQGINLRSSGINQEGCDFHNKYNEDNNFFMCSGNVFNIAVYDNLTRAQYINSEKERRDEAKCVFSRVEDAVIFGKKFTKIFNSCGVEYVIEDSGHLLNFSSSDFIYHGAQDDDRIMEIFLSTFRLIR